ncbi:MAG: CPBP family glutamic-type intramembrane protease [Gemmatimonadota bacterium]
MWRKPIVWIVLFLFAGAAVVTASAHFDEAFPVVSLDLRMDRQQALSAARERATSLDWSTSEFRQAASFGLRDSEVQTYVELEGGGESAWKHLLESSPYRPYIWTVREFREGDAHEARVRFAPDGVPVGFRLQIPEDEPGAALSVDSARALAEHAATSKWGVDLAKYHFLEASQEARPTGRVDHTFTYELNDQPYGDARVRLRLGVVGGSFAQLTHLVKVPEAFTRHYEDMRSRNTLIALISNLAFIILYFGGGCGLALLLLLRAGWVRWRTPLKWASIIGVLMFLASLNQLPLQWMGYDTAVSASSFLTRQVLTAVGAFVGTALLLTVVFMTAETMDRRAFPQHVQLWRVWKGDVARSNTVLGQTLGGYLFTGFFITYAVVFYLVATHVLRWWSPSEAMVQPDLLATPFPWISGVATSFFAGFWEESLFRAVPLAGAALLGERFGRRKAWIVGALLLEALVFASAHANYAQQPAYARVVELFLPAIALGLVYLRFGLLPGVLAHATYDLTWFSLPLFSMSGAPSSKAIVIVAALVPLGVVLVARLRRGARREASADAYNRAWTPVTAKPAPRGAVEPGAAAAGAAGAVPGEAQGLPAEGGVAEGGEGREGVAAGGVAGVGAGAGEGAAEGMGAGARPARGLGAPVLIAGLLVGMALWVLFVRTGMDTDRLVVSAQQAETTARAVLAKHHVELDDSWRTLRTVTGSPSAADRFVWQEGGPAAYRMLLGHFLPGPRWHVRFARFTGPVADRAEEYDVWVGPTVSDTRYQHVLPEARPGGTLTQQQAHDLAVAAVHRNYDFPEDSLTQVSAQQQKRPNRLDWTITFSVPSVAKLPEDAQTRVAVDIAGDEVVSTGRFVHVPESWQRADRGRQSLHGVIRLAGGGLLLLLAIALLVFGIIRWSRRRYAPRAFLAVAGVVTGLILVQSFGRWPSIVADFSTAQPLGFQEFAVIAGLLLGGLIAGSIFGLLGGLGHTPDSLPHGRRNAVLAGLAVGALLAGVLAAIQRLAPDRVPTWPDFAGAAATVPFLAALLAPVINFVLTVVGALAAVVAFDAADGGGRRPWASVAVTLAVGIAFAGLETGASIVQWAAASAAAWLVLYGLLWLVRRVGRAVLPPLVAVMMILDAVVFTLRAPYPGAWTGGVLAVLVVAAAGLWWGVRLRRWEPAD